MDSTNNFATAIGAGRQGVVKNEQTPLAEFCEGDFVDLKPGFGKLRVEHLRGSTVEQFVAEYGETPAMKTLLRLFLLQTLDDGNTLESFLRVVPALKSLTVLEDLSATLKRLCPNPRPDRFERVADLGPLPFFRRTLCRREQYSEVLRIWYDTWKEQNSRAPLVITSGAPGDGKTRLVWVLAQRHVPLAGNPADEELETAIKSLLTRYGTAEDFDVEMHNADGDAVEERHQSQKQVQKFVKKFRSAIGITVTFGHQTGLVEGEDPVRILGVRMLYSYFGPAIPFGRFALELSKDCVFWSELDAFELIRKDIDSRFPDDDCSVILVIDELVMSKHDETVLKSITTLMADRPGKRNDLFVIATHLSPFRVSQLESGSGRRLHPVMNTPLTEDAVEILVQSQAGMLEKLLRTPALSSLITDCGGVPRCLELVFKTADAMAGSLRQFQVSRITVLDRMCEQVQLLPSFSSEASWRNVKRAMLHALARWAVHGDRGLQERENLFATGYLHVMNDSEYGIPVIFFYCWWRRHQSDTLLSAILDFLGNEGMESFIAEGKRFEIQVAALFRILAIVDETVRGDPDNFSQPAPRSMFSLVRCDGFKSCCVAATKFSDASILRRLRARSYDDVCSYRFKYGDSLDELDPGIYFPALENHAGFDMLLIDVTEDGLPFLTAVECKFSTEDDVGSIASRTTPAEMAKKLCDSLHNYPCFVVALKEKRFCFIAACFQSFNGQENPGGLARKAHEYFQQVDRAAAKIDVKTLEGSIILLRRAHVKALLSPTLANRYHFFRHNTELIRAYGYE